MPNFFYPSYIHDCTNILYTIILYADNIHDCTHSVHNLIFSTGTIHVCILSVYTPILCINVRTRPECTLIYIKYIPIMYIPARLHPRLLGLNLLLHLSCINKNNLPRWTTVSILYIPWLYTQTMHPCCIYPHTLPRQHSRLKTTCKLILYQKLINVCTRKYITQHSILSTSTTQPSCIHPDAIPRLHPLLYPSAFTPTLHPEHTTVRTMALTPDYIHATSVPTLFIH